MVKKNSHQSILDVQAHTQHNPSEALTKYISTTVKSQTSCLIAPSLDRQYIHVVNLHYNSQFL